MNLFACVNRGGGKDTGVFLLQKCKILTRPGTRRHYSFLTLTPSHCFPSSREQRVRRAGARRTPENCCTYTWRGTDIAKFKFTFKVRHMKTDVKRVIYDNPAGGNFLYTCLNYSAFANNMYSFIISLARECTLIK